jgi:hypothetical protein
LKHVDDEKEEEEKKKKTKEELIEIAFLETIN